MSSSSAAHVAVKDRDRHGQAQSQLGVTAGGGHTTYLCQASLPLGKEPGREIGKRFDFSQAILCFCFVTFTCQRQEVRARGQGLLYEILGFW